MIRRANPQSQSFIFLGTSLSYNQRLPPSFVYFKQHLVRLLLSVHFTVFDKSRKPRWARSQASAVARFDNTLENVNNLLGAESVPGKCSSIGHKLSDIPGVEPAKFLRRIPRSVTTLRTVTSLPHDLVEK